MNTLLLKSSRMLYHTDMALVFQALGGRQKEFNWLITNCEGHAVGDSWGTRLPDVAFGEEPKIVSGSALTEIFEQIEIQFIWGNLSGFAPDVALDLAELEV